MTPEDMEDYAYALLKRKYTQRSDARQKEMGLSYTTAETRDLAKTLVQFASACMAQQAAEAAENAEDRRQREIAEAIGLGFVKYEAGQNVTPPDEAGEWWYHRDYPDGDWFRSAGECLNET